MKIPHLDPEFAKSRKDAWPNAFRIACVLLATIWICFFLAQVLPITQFGLKPRRFEGLIGLFSMPLIHSGWPHLIDNTLPMFLAFLGLFGNYPRLAKKVLIQAVLMTGLLVWFFARDLNHIGSSGLFYALLSYLFISGFLKKDLQSIGLSILIAFMYGSLIWGILPGQPGISWESHLAGLLTGIYLAFQTRKQELPVLKDWRLDEGITPDSDEF